MKGQNAGAADILASAQPGDDGIEDQRAADLDDVRLRRATRAWPHARKGSGLMQPGDRPDPDVSRTILIEALAMQRARRR